MDVPLPILEREVERAATAAAHGLARLARGEDLGAPGPLARLRRPSTRETWLELGESKDPLAAPLRAWVAELTLTRVLWADHARLAAAWHTPSIPVEQSGVSAFLGSPRELLRRLLADPAPGRRRVFADALAGGAAPVASAARRLADRRAEATRLLGPGAARHTIPTEPPTALLALAERVLADTAAFGRDPGGDWDEALAATLGRSAVDGWPARLNNRWLFDLFHHGPLLEGLRLELPPLPAALGAASFARALGSFGAALADADGPRSAPFALCRAPFDLRRARRAALFASLPADPVFTARALGVGRWRARDQAREVARALALSLRLDAARVLLGDALLLPERQRDARFEERTYAALGVPLPVALSGVVPRLGPGDPTRLVGAILALGDRRRLVESFDEDWFQSPHAGLALREEDSVVPASPFVAAAAVEAGLAEVVRALHDLG
jgi:hypothetical protein